MRPRGAFFSRLPYDVSEFYFQQGGQSFFPIMEWPVSVAAERADGESEGESIVVLTTIVTAQIPITVIPIPDEGLYRVAGTTVLRLQLALVVPSLLVIGWISHFIQKLNHPPVGNGKRSRRKTQLDIFGRNSAI